MTPDSNNSYDSDDSDYPDDTLNSDNANDCNIFQQSCIQVCQYVDSSDSTTKPYSQEIFHKQMLKMFISLNLPFCSADNMEL